MLSTQSSLVGVVLVVLGLFLVVAGTQCAKHDTRESTQTQYSASSGPSLHIHVSGATSLAGCAQGCSFLEHSCVYLVVVCVGHVVMS